MSEDFGATFQRVDNTPCSDIVTDPTNGNILYRVSLLNGIFESRDGGTTWSVITTPAQMGTGFYGNDTVLNARMSLHVDPEQKSRVLYCGLLARSPLAILRGEYNEALSSWNFTTVDLPYTLEGDKEEGLSPRKHDNDDEDDEEDDDEEEEREGGSQGMIHFSIAADRSNPSIVYVAGDRQPFGANSTFPNSIGANDFSGRLFRIDASKPRGSQSTPLTHRYTSQNSAPHADSRSLATDADGNLLETDDGGVFKRTSPQSDTGNWFSLNGNLAVLEAHSVRYVKTGHFVSGNQDVGCSIGNLTVGAPWLSIQKGDGGFIRVGYNQTHALVYLSYYSMAGFGYAVMNLKTGDIVDRVYSNMTLQPYGLPLNRLVAVSFYQVFELNRFNPDRMIIPLPGLFAILESSDRADNWNLTVATGIYPALDPATTGTSRGFIAAAFGGKSGGIDNPDFVVALGGEVLAVRATRNGRLLTTPTFPPVGIYSRIGSSLTVNPAEHKEMWVLFGDSGEVAHTADQGNSWDVLPRLPVPPMTADIGKIVYVKGNFLLVSSRVGVLLLNAERDGWNLLDNFPRGLIMDIAYDLEADLLYMSAMGRGVFSLASASAKLQQANLPRVAPVASPIVPPASLASPASPPVLSPFGESPVAEPASPPPVVAPEASPVAAAEPPKALDSPPVAAATAPTVVSAAPANPEKLAADAAWYRNAFIASVFFLAATTVLAILFAVLWWQSRVKARSVISLARTPFHEYHTVGQVDEGETTIRLRPSNPDPFI